MISTHRHPRGEPAPFENLMFRGSACSVHIMYNSDVIDAVSCNVHVQYVGCRKYEVSTEIGTAGGTG